MGKAGFCFTRLPEAAFSGCRQDRQVGSGQRDRGNGSGVSSPEDGTAVGSAAEATSPPAGASEAQDEGLQIWTNNGNLEELFEFPQFRYP